jgi:hypothetical protein
MGQPCQLIEVAADRTNLGDRLLERHQFGLG